MYTFIESLYGDPYIRFERAVEKDYPKLSLLPIGEVYSIERKRLWDLIVPFDR